MAIVAMEKLSTNMEADILDTGLGSLAIMLILRDMDLELYTLKKDKCSIKAGGKVTDLWGRSNTKGALYLGEITVWVWLIFCLFTY